ncbi:hypothetical protein IV84_GL000212 [Pediococcus damnosus]|nr:hypothetical protein IV84_GL000212 [Pediococcus damnosus]
MAFLSIGLLLFYLILAKNYLFGKFTIQNLFRGVDFGANTMQTLVFIFFFFTIATLNFALLQSWFSDWLILQLIRYKKISHAFKNLNETIFKLNVLFHIMFIILFFVFSELFHASSSISFSLLSMLLTNFLICNLYMLTQFLFNLYFSDRVGYFLVLVYAGLFLMVGESLFVNGGSVIFQILAWPQFICQQRLSILHVNLLVWYVILLVLFMLVEGLIYGRLRQIDWLRRD